MKKVLNITQSNRNAVADLLNVVDTVLNIENGSNAPVCVLNLVIPSGTEIMHCRAGNTRDCAFSKLDIAVRRKARSLVGAEDSEPEVIGPDGVHLQNGLTMVIGGFSWEENKLAALWIGYEMGWVDLITVRDVVIEKNETIEKYRKLFRYFSTIVQQKDVA